MRLFRLAPTKPRQRVLADAFSTLTTAFRHIEVVAIKRMAVHTMRLLAPILSPLSAAILCIVGASTEKQVIWIYARPDIATVADKQRAGMLGVSRNRTVGKFPCDTMGTAILSVEPCDAIPGSIQTPKPQVASRIWLGRRVIQKSLFIHAGNLAFSHVSH